jgi:hypothetical protein
MNSLYTEPLTITPEGIRHLCNEIDMLQDEIKMLKNQLAAEKDKRKNDMRKLKSLVFELDAEK